MNHRVRIYQTGTPDVLQYESFTDELGAPGPRQVRLRQDAIGLNFVDTMFRDGTFPVQFPFDMGVEGAGIVEAVGADVTELKIGDRAAYFFSFGAYADVRLIDVDALVKLPDDISNRTAASLMAKGLTAWVLLKRAHVVQPGEFVVVHGAAGGVGSMVSSWARALGATVIATAGTPHKISGIRARGIEHVLQSDAPDLGKQILALTGGRAVDVVYELVGKATFDHSLHVLRAQGDLIHVGNASGVPSAEQVAAVAVRSVRHVQPVTGQYISDRQTLEAASADVFAAYRSGMLDHTVPAIYPLAEVVRAHRDIAERKIMGPAILIP
jgi:NADPH2:quinone reductase